MDDKKVKFSTRNPSELVPNEDNPRHMTRMERNKLAQSLKEFGFVDPVVINTYPGRENRIIGGHQRVEAAKGIGLESVPVAEVCLSKEKESILNIALNRITGAWDEDKLVKIMMELNAKQENLLATGFSEHELDRMMKNAMEEQKDVVPEPPEEAVCKPRELWALGAHRLMCGDATKSEDVKILMAGKTADMLLTDPPWGVDYGTKNAFLNKADKGNRNQKDIISDNLKAKEFFEFSKAWLAQVPLSDYNSVYIFMAGRTMHHVINAMEAVGITYCGNLVWVKNVQILGRADYAYKHENVIFGWKEHENVLYGWKDHHRFFGEHPSSVLNYDKPMSSKSHPTMKPTKMLCFLMLNSSQPGALVLDVFGGSGSTMIACEQTERVCYMMELDPRYCDVIIKRWEDYTGKKSERVA